MRLASCVIGYVIYASAGAPRWRSRRESTVHTSLGASCAAHIAVLPVMPTANSTPRSFDLHAAARAALRKYDLSPDIPASATQQLAALPPWLPSGDPTVTDLRALLWSSIDDDTSRDLDQIEVAEAVTGGTLVRVGIADVDTLVTAGSALDQSAARNATTVYTGVETFPMLPLELSTDRTSLAPGQDRPAIVLEYTVMQDGSTTAARVYRALVRNQAQLAYDSVSAWLAGKGPAPGPVSASPPLAAQLRLQSEAAQRLRARRAQRGALDLETIEATPVVDDGHVVALRVVQPGAARDLIEDFMIAANATIATFLATKGRAAIRRVVRVPRRWSRIVELARQEGAVLPEAPDGHALAAFLDARRAADPAHFPDLSLAVIKLLGPGEYAVEPAGAPSIGHFGLAAPDYTHGTAPNRRYADLVTERLLKAAVSGAAAPYTDAELADIAAHCTLQEDNARRAERLVHKQAAAVLLASRIGNVFDAVVTGVTDDGTFARIVAPPVEGRIMTSARHLDVGDDVRVRLLSTDPMRGFIDFQAL
jgi:VacB/RNase II family 3'-5' exoribonuclease